jgi:hypothetical protein
MHFNIFDHQNWDFIINNILEIYENATELLGTLAKKRDPKTNDGF